MDCVEWFMLTRLGWSLIQFLALLIALTQVRAYRRRQSTTPIQALNLFNSQFTIDESKAMAKRIKEDVGLEISRQVISAYWLAYGRDPQPDEMSDAESVVRLQGLETFCRAIFNSNEFLFIP